MSCQCVHFRILQTPKVWSYCATYDGMYQFMTGAPQAAMALGRCTPRSAPAFIDRSDVFVSD
jgi:hypothetical protein